MFIFLDIDGVLNKNPTRRSSFHLIVIVFVVLVKNIEVLVLFGFLLGRMALFRLIIRRILHR